MPENRNCGGFGFGDDCMCIIVIILLLCCCCGGGRGCKKLTSFNILLKKDKAFYFILNVKEIQKIYYLQIF